MKKFTLAIICILGLSNAGFAQTSIICTDNAAAQALLGNYNPATYLASAVINNHDSITLGINAAVSPDTLRSYIYALKGFQTRNTASDTISTIKGIGAARRWVYAQFQQMSALCGGRLIPSYLQFNLSICGVGQHRDVFGVLPGMDTSDKSIIIIEGHLDSRTVNVCDTASIAQGVEDNGSGSALVLELARVMSRFSYNHTIVFLITTGEEQGLYGATAFSNYAYTKGIQVKAVLNNDVIGGVICGYTSSPPSCPSFDNVDSTNMRIFSYGGFNSLYKGLARYIKLAYSERLLPVATVPMGISIMTPEDRTGRSGDHIPFRVHSFTAVRMTAANEDGDANVTDTAYKDRQHTSRDSVGIDINGDGIIDTFWEDFDYLARNAVINGNAASMIAIGPKTPAFAMSAYGSNVVVQITSLTSYLHYKVGIRTTTYDWDSVYEFSGTLTDTIYLPPNAYIASVASVDSNGVESLFSGELMENTSVPGVSKLSNGIELLQNKPNPFDEATTFSVFVHETLSYKDAHIAVTDLQGKEVERIPVTLNTGMNEALYRHGDHMSGSFIYTLVVDGMALQSHKMVFAN